MFGDSIDIQVSKNGNVDVVHLKGDVDLYSSPQIRNEFSKFLAKPTPLIIVNFSLVDYIDSSGLATLIELLQKLKKTGGHLFLACVGDTVRSVFQLAKLDGIFRIYDNENSAL